MLHLLAPLLAGVAHAQEIPRYLDDRSDPAALVRSYYNAVARHELARAYAYLAVPPDYGRFAQGYADTASIELELGPVASEGAAGSVYATVPAAVRATSAGGAVTVFAGCYTTRQVQPAIQEPPFRPIEIVSGRMATITPPRGTSLAAAVPGACPVDGG